MNNWISIQDKFKDYDNYVFSKIVNYQDNNSCENQNYETKGDHNHDHDHDYDSSEFIGVHY